MGEKGKAGKDLQASQLALMLGAADEGQHSCHHTAADDLVAGNAVVLT